MSVPAEQQIVFAALYAVELQKWLAEADAMESRTAAQNARLNEISFDHDPIALPWTVPSAPVTTKQAWAALCATQTARILLLQSLAGATAASAEMGSSIDYTPYFGITP